MLHLFIPDFAFFEGKLALSDRTLPCVTFSGCNWSFLHCYWCFRLDWRSFYAQLMRFLEHSSLFGFRDFSLCPDTRQVIGYWNSFLGWFRTKQNAHTVIHNKNAYIATKKNSAKIVHFQRWQEIFPFLTDGIFWEVRIFIFSGTCRPRVRSFCVLEKYDWSTLGVLSFYSKRTLFDQTSRKIHIYMYM